MVNICILPNTALMGIMKYLRVSDILNLRLTCSCMFKLSKCKSFFKRVNIRITNLSRYDYVFLKNLCDSYENILAMRINHFQGNLTFILPYIRHVKEMIVNVKHLKRVCMECPNIETLVVDLHSLGIYNCVSGDDFTYLSQLPKLKELVIGVSNVDRPVLDKSMLYDIFASTKCISKIKFVGEMVIKGRDSKKHPDEKQLLESLKKIIKSSSHIQEWTFSHVLVNDDIFLFPNNIKFLVWSGPKYLNFTDSVDSSLEKLVIHSFQSDFSKVENFNLKSLKFLELEIYEDSSHTDNVINVLLPKLELLSLRFKRNLYLFEPFFLPTLKTLILSTSATLNDGILKMMLETCTSLEFLIIHDTGFHLYRESLGISEPCLKHLLNMTPCLKIKFVDVLKNKNLGFESITISTENFDKAVRKMKHLLL